MNIRKMLSIMLCVSMITLTACNKASDSNKEQPNEEVTVQSAEEATNTVSTVADLTGEYSEEEIEASWEDSAATNITFNNSTIDIDGTGAKSDNNIVTINQAGTYVLSGTLTDGQIVVDANDNDNIQIVLKNANLSSTTSSPLYVKNAKNVYLTLAEDSINSVFDAEKYIYENETDDEPNAAIFSKADLIINGTGSLTVTGNYNNGIRSKDDLKIVDGTINVISKDDGIIGKDSITIRTGNITVNSQGDAFKSTNAEDTSKGFVIIDGGNFTITSGSDGFQAETTLIVNAGTFDITTNGGSANASMKDNGDFNANWGTPPNRETTTSPDTTNTSNSDTNIKSVTSANQTTPSDETASTTKDETVSAKAFKAGAVLTINDGVYHIDSSDDGIHSNGTVTVTGGNFELASGDDGIHADSILTIDDGTILITKSYEGIESENININGGTITLTASDDGINVSGGNDSSSVNGRPGQNGFESSGDGVLTINGGVITVDARGDGLDANGSIVINGGTTYVSGSTDGGNGVLDYDQTFDITGGILMAAGSTGMAMTPSDSSTQASVVMVYDAVQSAGSIVHLEDSDGNEIVTFSPSKDYQFVIISSPSITKDTTLNLYADGTYSTESTNNVYGGGMYKAGTLVHSFTVSDIINANQTITSNGGFGGGKGGQGGPMDGNSGERPERPEGAGGMKGNGEDMTPPDATNNAE
ncbi:MAG: dockerin type 1 [Anaerocolumna sp.]|nr:dockerin type 1 [Anaerocolumna sp.]